MMVSQLIEALHSKPSAEQQLRRVADWGQRNAAACQEASRIFYCMATDALLADARGYGSNDFKIPLARRVLVATLRDLTGE